MKKFEYKSELIAKSNLLNETVKRKLNEYGYEGWRLSQVVQAINQEALVYIFERELNINWDKLMD